MTALVAVGFSCSVFRATGCCRSAIFRTSTSPPFRCNPTCQERGPETIWRSSVAAGNGNASFRLLPGFDNMTSSSFLARPANITLQFTLDREHRLCQPSRRRAERHCRGQPQAPAQPAGPAFHSKGESHRPARPASWQMVSSVSPPITAVDEYAETLIGQPSSISTIDGVSQVVINGQSKFAVRIQLDPNKLMNRGISLEDVQNVVGNHNAPIFADRHAVGPQPGVRGADRGPESIPRTSVTKINADRRLPQRSSGAFGRTGPRH